MLPRSEPLCCLSVQPFTPTSRIFGKQPLHVFGSDASHAAAYFHRLVLAVLTHPVSAPSGIQVAPVLWGPSV